MYGKTKTDDSDDLSNKYCGFIVSYIITQKLSTKFMVSFVHKLSL